MSWVYIDGDIVLEPEARIAAAGAGVLHARGVYETFRARRVETGGEPEYRIYRLDRHLDRLEAGVRVVGIDQAPARDALRAAIDALLRRSMLDDARVRLTLTAGVDRPSLVIQARPAADYPERLYESGVSAVVASTRRNETSPLSRVKSVNCLDNILERQAARDSGALEALFLNTRGDLAEGAGSNVFVVVRGVLLTPRVDDGALPGITRAAVLDLARQAGIEARETALTLDDLLAAGEAFLTNAIAGVLPLVEAGGTAIGDGRPGPVTGRLRSAYLRGALGSEVSTGA